MRKCQIWVLFLFGYWKEERILSSEKAQLLTGARSYLGKEMGEWGTSVEGRTSVLIKTFELWADLGLLLVWP